MIICPGRRGVCSTPNGSFAPRRSWPWQPRATVAMSLGADDDRPVETGDGDTWAAVHRLWQRRAAFGPFALVGVFWVLAGGLTAAAIAAPAPTRHGVWAVAYFILVLGMGQIVLGAGQATLAAAAPSVRQVAVTAAAFNTANIAIVAGIVTDHLVVFDAGAALLVAVLVWFLLAVHRDARRGWPLYVYRLLIAVLVVSIPIGMALTTAHTS